MLHTIMITDSIKTTLDELRKATGYSEVVNVIRNSVEEKVTDEVWLPLWAQVREEIWGAPLEYDIQLHPQQNPSGSQF